MPFAATLSRDVHIEIARDHADQVGDFFQRFDIKRIGVEYIVLEPVDDFPILHAIAGFAVEKGFERVEVSVRRHGQLAAARDDFREKALREGGKCLPIVFEKRFEPFRLADFQLPWRRFTPQATKYISSLFLEGADFSQTC